MPKKSGAPATRRITLELPAELFARLEALAAAERRELKPQVLILLERGCKMHEGRKRSASTRATINRLFNP